MKFDRVQFWTDPKHVSDELKQVNGGKLYRFTQPEFYLGMDWGSRMALATFGRLAQPDWSYLEYGCNTGKCMAALKKAGYTNVTGIEINPHAIELGRKHFPILSGSQIINAPLEDVIRDLPEFDVFYGVGVLMHIPYELDWVIEEIARKARRLIMTAENEMETDFFKYQRNYREYLERFGWKQIEEEPGSNYPPIPATTIKRVFVRESGSDA